MSAPWAIQLPADKLRATGSLRLRPGLLAAMIDGIAWVRGSDLTEELDQALRLVPGATRFNVSAGGMIVLPGARLPLGRLPDLQWRPLSELLAFAPQPAALAGRLEHRASLRLDQGGPEKPASVLITALSDWTAYAVSAPLVRLRLLCFAVADDGRTVVRGMPLPPIRGERYVDEGGIAAPCGFRLVPEMDSTTWHALLGTQPTDLALFHQDSSWEFIGADHFVAAGRANVRATSEAVGLR